MHSMKKHINFFLTIPGVAAITALILMVPLIAMQFTHEVNWSVFDFMLMGVLIFSTGAAYVLITRYASNLAYRLAFFAAIGSSFLLIWVNLAVGLIGGGPNAGNLMYIGVLCVLIVGTYLSRFTSVGMERVMLATAFSIIVVAIIALLMGMDKYPGSSIGEIIGVNAFFAMLFFVSALLFRFVSLQQPAEKSNG